MKGKNGEKGASGRSGQPEDGELTAEEKTAFQRLSREAAPSELLEERVVRSLREEGILWTVPSEIGPRTRIPGAGGAGDATRRPEPGRGPRSWVAAAAVAASLALFASGMVVGQWVASKTASEALVALREQDASHLALRIQEAGSMYVAALAAMTRLQGRELSAGGAVDPAANALFLQQGREAAFGALYGAANELARLSPEDGDVLRVLKILEDRRGREEGWGAEDRNTVWF